MDGVRYSLALRTPVLTMLIVRYSLVAGLAPIPEILDFFSIDFLPETLIAALAIALSALASLYSVPCAPVHDRTGVLSRCLHLRAANSGSQ